LLLIVFEQNPHQQTLPQASIPHFTPKARRNNRKAPASPHTTRAGGAEREGHPGIVKAKGGGGRNEECMGTAGV